VRAAAPGTVEVRQDAGVVALWNRTPEGAAFPDDLPGTYAWPFFFLAILALPFETHTPSIALVVTPEIICASRYAIVPRQCVP
jgi:hypothetical protein